MTPLEGLMMGTRAGSIDPGIVFQLLREGRPVRRRSRRTLTGGPVCSAVGGTADMAALLDREAAGMRRRRLAIELFVRRAAAGIAASATTLPSVDAIVFTGGIGQHAGAVTERIRERLHLVGPDRDVTESTARTGSTGRRPAPPCCASRPARTWSSRTRSSRRSDGLTCKRRVRPSGPDAPRDPREGATG